MCEVTVDLYLFLSARHGWNHWNRWPCSAVCVLFRDTSTRVSLAPSQLPFVIFSCYHGVCKTATTSCFFSSSFQLSVTLWNHSSLESFVRCFIIIILVSAQFEHILNHKQHYVVAFHFYCLIAQIWICYSLIIITDAHIWCSYTDMECLFCNLSIHACMNCNVHFNIHCQVSSVLVPVCPLVCSLVSMTTLWVHRGSLFEASDQVSVCRRQCFRSVLLVLLSLQWRFV